MGIDSTQLSLDIEHLAYAGVVLSAELRAALQTSLAIIRDQYKFKKVYFWGKIFGTRKDYYIAEGAGKSEISEKTVLYSDDCIRWKLLNQPTQEHLLKLEYCKGRFTGDPTHEFDCKKYNVVGEGDEEHIEEETILLKEEDRLSAVIYKIDEEALIVPRGAFIQTPTGEVVRNRLFEGLPVNESAKFNNYLHFRNAKLLRDKPLLYRANLDKAIDFLDAIDEDEPKGCWSLQFERGSSLVLLRSLKWMGSVAFHVPESKSFGSLYWGIGEQNKDIPFML